MAMIDLKRESSAAASTELMAPNDIPAAQTRSSSSLPANRGSAPLFQSRIGASNGRVGPLAALLSDRLAMDHGQVRVARMVGRSNDIAVTGQIIAPERVLMPIPAVAMRKNDQRELAVPDLPIPPRIVPKGFVQLGGGMFVSLLYEPLHLRSQPVPKEVRILVFRQMPRVLRGRVPDFRHQRSRLLRERIRAVRVHQDSRGDPHRKRSRRAQIRLFALRLLLLPVSLPRSCRGRGEAWGEGPVPRDRRRPSSGRCRGN